MTETRRSPLAVRLPEDLEELLKEQADQADQTFPQYVRSVLAASTEQNEQTPAPV